ncbi:MAG: hypothetical protein ACJ8GN_09380 [Longimicrobiaceae bacterium]
MSGTPAPSKSTPSHARTPAERLKALADLQATARERLDRTPGFLASLDDATIEAFLQSDQPEVLGSWPDKNTEK